MIEERIVKFFRKHHVLTVATTNGSEPWCASCFYVYLPEENALVFTSDPATRHGKEFAANSLVAGTVVLETRVLGRIRGIQFQGIISVPEGDRHEKAKKAYLRRFPIAMLMETHMWVVDLTLIKMTDNRLGFGNKIFWQKNLITG